MADYSEIVYVVDRHDLLVSVCPEWEQFAERNGGHGLNREQLVGQSLWKFIEDAPTRELYRDVLAHVRSGQDTALVLRCDSPDRRRLIELTISHQGDETVQFQTRLLSSKSRPFQRLYAASTPRSTSRLMVCSWCERIHLKDDRWVEVEDAMEALRLADARELPRVRPVVCPACYAKVIEILSHPPLKLRP